MKNLLFLHVAFLSVFYQLGCQSRDNKLNKPELLAYVSDSLQIERDNYVESLQPIVHINVDLVFSKYDNRGFFEEEVGSVRGILSLGVDSIIAPHFLRVVSFQCDTLITNNAIFAIGGHSFDPGSTITTDVLFLPDSKLPLGKSVRKISIDNWSETCLHPLKDHYNRYFNSSHFFIKIQSNQEGWLIKTDFIEMDLAMFSTVISKNSKSWKDKILRYKVHLSLAQEYPIVTKS